ncbi:MAG: ATP-binding cassette domain-containing protein [Bacteroidetes bacterium]|nr:MAG: ATP-binding cassette domain-containing protein [Bacteroidota bacterium]
MDSKITHISKIEIKKLWGFKDIEWNLNPDVNILAGDNGSGKSTILKLVAGLMLGVMADDVKEMAEEVIISFNDINKINFFRVAKSSKDIDSSTKMNTYLEKLTADMKQKGEIYLNLNVEALMTEKELYIYIDMNHEDFLKILPTNIINTFDQALIGEESIQKLSDNQVKTQLDFQIYQLQNKYKDYQINLGKRAIESLKKEKNGLEEIDAKKNLFFDTIDHLFSSTQKHIDRQANDISFVLHQEKISPYQLSSGEKQILVILLTALIQDNKNCVMILDEPEISLHTDWQKELIRNIRNLNTNVQIIIATHSPFIVAKGWASEKYVFQMDKITLK